MLFYNELTFELLKTFFLLLQFGFFKLVQQDNENSYFRQKTKTFHLNDYFSGKKDSNDEACLKKILKILAFLLEFEEDYFRDLQINNIKRGEY